MKKFKVGEKARIVSMPDKGKHLVGEVVRVVVLGGLSSEEDDVAAVTESCMMILVSEDQLAKIDS